jgi:hypothetical protein
MAVPAVSTSTRRVLNTGPGAWTRRDLLRGLAVCGAGLAAGLHPRTAGADALTSGPLFDGRSLGHWRPVEFGGQGEVRIDEGAIVLERGNDLTAIVWTGNLPPPSYTLSLEAMRIDGSDFFCGLTFPVAGSHATFVVGGWGGSLIGISSLEDLDAAENETSQVRPLQDGRWYRVTVEVTPALLRASLDEERLVDLALAGRQVDVRAEMELCRPLGVASYRTRAAIRDIRLHA